MKDRPGELIRYCEAHTTPVSEVLYRLERETHLRTLSPQMLSGHLQGQLLRMISAMIRPRQALEIGTFTGYSAICIAVGMPADSVLHTIEANVELR
ncbi:MAG TPA: methyltransferase, partial [Saprospiraceae bacterium]|nr:methyltransferase [Saprospiraceae bacterium]